MKRKILSLLSLLIAIISFSQKNSIEYYTKQAPFAMPKVEQPKFSNKTFNIKDFGAIPDGKTLNTQAFAKAIIECNKSGGGIVLVNEGTWLTAPIELKSNVNLRLDKGAVIQFTTDHTQYPIIKAGGTSTSYTPASPIYSYDAENIAITGEGIIDGAGDSWRQVKKSKVSVGVWAELNKTGVLSNDGKIWWPTKEAMNGEDYLKNAKKEKGTLTAEDYLPARDFLRPHMVYFVGCKNILIQGVTIRNSPKFVFYPSRCNNLTIDGANIFNDWWAQNGDGIDISASKNVVIYNTTVSVGDDGICMKSSGKNGGTDDANLENILIAECTVYRAHGGFVIGSNTDGGMKNIYVTNCNFIGSDIGIRVKSNAGRGGKVQNIYCDNIKMSNIVNEAISFDTYYEDVVAGKDKVVTTAKDKIPEFTNFYLSNITCEGAATAIYINGLPEMPVHNIYFDNVNITAKKGFVANFAQDIDCSKLKLNASKPLYKLENTKNITGIN
ncbi:MAG: glycoside hydrolase family 28 protein [Chitinophagaceae bacterium]